MYKPVLIRILLSFVMSTDTSHSLNLPKKERSWSQSFGRERRSLKGIPVFILFGEIHEGIVNVSSLVSLLKTERIISTILP